MEHIFVTLQASPGAPLPEPGRIIRLFRAENAVIAELPYVGRIGTVAGTPADVLPGTFPGTRLADLLIRPVFARILFLFGGGAVAEITELPVTPKPARKTRFPGEDGLFEFIADVRAVPSRNFPV